MFIKLFEKKYIGPVVNFFIEAINEGNKDYESIINYLTRKFNRQKSYRNFPAYKQKLIDNFNNPDIYPFIDEWLKYKNLPRNQQLVVKQIKQSSKNMQKRLIKDIINNQRPLSWSSISQWQYSREEWFKKYVEGQKTATTKEMEFGKKIGSMLELDPKYLPQIPRHSKMEHPFRVVFSGVPLIGYADTFCDKTFKKLGEFKTGKKEWNQSRCDQHGQIDMYLLMNYITNKVRPEDVDITLVWMPTQDNSDFSISFVEPIEDNIKIFKTKRTMEDILRFGKKIKDVYTEMQEFVENMAN